MAITSAKFASASDGTGNSSYSPSVNPSVGVTYGNKFKGVKVNRAYNNTAYSFEKYGKKLTWKLSYSHLSSADKQKLEALFAYTIGRKKDFYFAEDGSSYSYNVRFTKDTFEFREVAVGVFSISISFEED
jgi:hypothetical protein